MQLHSVRFSFRVKKKKKENALEKWMIKIVNETKITVARARRMWAQSTSSNDRNLLGRHEPGVQGEAHLANWIMHWSPSLPTPVNSDRLVFRRSDVTRRWILGEAKKWNSWLAWKEGGDLHRLKRGWDITSKTRDFQLLFGGRRFAISKWALEREACGQRIRPRSFLFGNIKFQSKVVLLWLRLFHEKWMVLKSIFPKNNHL